MRQGTTKKILGIGLASILLAAACVGTEIGNPQDGEPSQVTMELKGVDRESAGALTLSNGIEITEAWMVFEEVQFRRGANCGETVDLGYEFVNIVELVSGVQTPGYGETVLASGSHCRVEMEVGPVELGELPEGVSADLADVSVLVRGAYEGEEFEVRFEDSESLEFHGLFELAPDRQSLFVVFALEQWLSPEQLAEVEAGEDGRSLIDEENTPELVEAFVDALLLSGSVVRDENGDGILQDEELEASRARTDAEPIGDDDEDDLEIDEDEVDAGE
jgi:hypothetical protein